MKFQGGLTVVCIHLGCVIIICRDASIPILHTVHVFWYLVDTDTEMINLLSVNQSGASLNIVFSSVYVYPGLYSGH